jgi:hypothetical protein
MYGHPANLLPTLRADLGPTSLHKFAPDPLWICRLPKPSEFSRYGCPIPNIPKNVNIVVYPKLQNRFGDLRLFRPTNEFRYGPYNVAKKLRFWPGASTLKRPDVVTLLFCISGIFGPRNLTMSHIHTILRILKIWLLLVIVNGKRNGCLGSDAGE